MKKFIIISGIVIIVVVWIIICNQQRDYTRIDGYHVYSHGPAAADHITDTIKKAAPLSIVQTVPPTAEYGTLSKLLDLVTSTLRIPMKALSSDKSIGEFPAQMPLTLFFSDQIYLQSLKDNFEVLANGKVIKGNIVLNTSADGNTILTFTPFDEFPSGSEIVVTVKKGLMNAAGKLMDNDLTLKYQIERKNRADFEESNFGFEKDENGISFIGDAAMIAGTKGSLAPFEGEKFLAMSSGRKIVSETGSAQSGTTSNIIIGPIDQEINTLSFHYNFISAEFNEFVNSKYDDCFIITITGPKGTYTEMVTSVNLIGKNNTSFDHDDNMPDAGNEYAGQTGWKLKEIDPGKTGRPVIITLTVSDVSDKIYSSVVAIDDIKIR